MNLIKKYAIVIIVIFSIGFLSSISQISGYSVEYQIHTPKIKQIPLVCTIVPDFENNDYLNVLLGLADEQPMLDALKHAQ